MKRKQKRLVLSRETLRVLDSSTLSRVAGGIPTGFTPCLSDCARCTGGPPGDGGGTGGSLCDTCNQCSADCQTGGACTVSC